MSNGGCCPLLPPPRVSWLRPPPSPHAPPAGIAHLPRGGAARRPRDAAAAVPAREPLLDDQAGAQRVPGRHSRRRDGSRQDHPGAVRAAASRGGENAATRMLLVGQVHPLRPWPVRGVRVQAISLIIAQRPGAVADAAAAAEGAAHAPQAYESEGIRKERSVLVRRHRRRHRTRSYQAAPSSRRLVTACSSASACSPSRAAARCSWCRRRRPPRRASSRNARQRRPRSRRPRTRQQQRRPPVSRAARARLPLPLLQTHLRLTWAPMRRPQRAPPVLPLPVTAQTPLTTATATTIAVPLPRPLHRRSHRRHRRQPPHRLSRRLLQGQAQQQRPRPLRPSGPR